MDGWMDSLIHIIFRNLTGWATCQSGQAGTHPHSPTELPLLPSLNFLRHMYHTTTAAALVVRKTTQWMRVRFSV